MSYSEFITRQNPSCLLFLIDQSSSMSGSFAGTTMKKDEAVAQSINSLIEQIGLDCTKEKTVRHYFDIGIIFYGDEAISLFEDELSNPGFIGIDNLYENPINLQEVAQRKPLKWIEAKADGYTNMYRAFRLGQNLLKDWVDKHPNSYPPILFNISDGNFTDDDPSSIAEEIKRIRTKDGEVLIFNINITDRLFV